MDRNEALHLDHNKEPANAIQYSLKETESKKYLDQNQLSMILHKTSMGLLKDNNWEEQILNLLQDTGELFKTSRIYIAKNIYNALESKMHRTLEWSNENVQPAANDKHWLNIANAHDSFQTWRSALAQGEQFYANTNELSENERILFSKLNVQSFALIPLSAGGSWWGVLGVEECQEQHDWSNDEKDALIKIAEVIEATLEGEQQKSSKKYIDAQQHFAALSYATNEMLYERHINGDYIWCSENIKKLFGYSEESASGCAAWWLSNIHPADWQIVSGSSLECIKQKRTTWSMHYRFRHADGYYVKIHDRAYITYSDHDDIRITGTICVTSKYDTPTTHSNYLEGQIHDQAITTSYNTNTVTTVFNTNI